MNARDEDGNEPKTGATSRERRLRSAPIATSPHRVTLRQWRCEEQVVTINAEDELDAAIRATASPNDWTRLDNASETSVERVDADSPTPDWRIPIAVEERHDETALLARRLDERRDEATAAARLARAARNDGD